MGVGYFGESAVVVDEGAVLAAEGVDVVGGVGFAVDSWAVGIFREYVSLGVDNRSAGAAFFCSDRD